MSTDKIKGIVKWPFDKALDALFFLINLLLRILVSMGWRPFKGWKDKHKQK